mmetsp:Transcript_10991/g.25103  ORF Transcript_10991/g.25103 Transcript_10991/m.25103 type:complete len:187 (+) Transcript_10991:92-652(+)
MSGPLPMLTRMLSGRSGGGQTPTHQECAEGQGQVALYPGSSNEQCMPQYASSSSQVATADEYQARQLVRQEVSNRLAAQIQHPTMPVQLIIQNHSSANSDQKVMNVTPTPEQRSADFRESVTQAWSSFVASPINRFFLLGAGFMLVWMFHERSQHRWRMAELQRRIESNIALRMVQQIFGGGNRSR